MSTQDDIKQLGKNQANLQKNFLSLKRRYDALEKRVVAIEGDSYEEESDYEQDYQPQEEAVSATPEKVSASKESRKPIENLGFKIFGGIGFLLIILGFFFLYSYAKDIGLLGPRGEIILGILFSIAVLILADVARRKEFFKFSQLLTGGGLALLYFTLYATYAFNIYRESIGMTLGINAVLLFAVMILAVMLALRHDSILLTCFAFFLGFLSSFLALLEHIFNLGGVIHLALISTLILSIGMAVVLWKKNWPLSLFPAIGSYLIYTIYFFSRQPWEWIPGHAAPIYLPTLIIYLLLNFLLFNVLALVLKDDKQHIQHIILSVLNAGLFFAFSLYIVQIFAPELRGLFSIAMACFYLFMASQAKKRALNNLFETLFIICITFLTITPPLQFDGFIVTMLWAIEGFLLVQVGLKLEHAGIRVLGYVVLGIGAIRSILYDPYVINVAWKRILNAGVMIASLFGTAYTLRVLKESMGSVERTAKNASLSAATLLLTIILAIESLSRNGLFQSIHEESRLVLLTFLWAIEAFLLIHLSAKHKSVIIATLGYILIGVLTFKTLIFDNISIDLWWRRSFSFVIVIALLYGLSSMLHDPKRREEQTAPILLSLFGTILLTVLFAREILDPRGLFEFLSRDGRQVLLSIVWALEAIVGITFGFMKGNSYLRMGGLVLFGITLAKVLLFDLGGMEGIYRTLVSIIVGVIALVGSFVYVKNKERLEAILKEREKHG